MKNDPIYLSKVCTSEASLGVLSVAGNVCRWVLSDNGFDVKVDLVLECLDGFGVLCEVEDMMPDSIEEVIG